MSIQSEIERIKSNVASAYRAVEEKGGVVPTEETVSNLSGAIQSIPDVIYTNNPKLAEITITGGSASGKRTYETFHYSSFSSNSIAFFSFPDNNFVIIRIGDFKSGKAFRFVLTKDFEIKKAWIPLTDNAEEDCIFSVDIGFMKLPNAEKEVNGILVVKQYNNQDAIIPWKIF